MIEVIKPGTKARTVLNNIPGIITKANIFLDSVTYEFSYFADSDYKSITLDEFEFTTDNAEKVTIGWKK